MVLKAIGKYIDTMPINDLLIQEEKLADTVVFEVDRWYNGWDLAEFTFAIRGVTESGGETEATLEMETGEDVLRLFWQVNELFTTEAGALALDLYAAHYAEDADPVNEPPECILRYQLPPVQVRGLPDSDSILENHSYTDFLLEVKAAANDAIAMINSIVADFEANQPDYESQLAEHETAISLHENKISVLETKTEVNAANIQTLQEQAGAASIVALTQSEFDTIETPDEGTLYVVTQG